MAATKAAKYTKELAEHFYETMCTIRKFEESVKHDFLNGEIPALRSESTRLNSSH